MSREPLSVAVVGTGLIGASIGLALRAAGHAVIGFDVDPAAARDAQAIGALDEVAATLEGAVRDARVAFVCVPVDAVPSVLGAIAAAPGDATVTDAGSVKEPIVTAGTAALGARFVGGHPMAGSERTGPHAADARLFEEASWILTPTGGTETESYRTVARLVSAVGARPLALHPHVHDELVANLSHVPQVVASAIVNLVTSSIGDRALLPLAAGGFRDVTRIAASDPDLWIPILKSNHRAVLEGLERAAATIGEAAERLRANDWDGLRGFLASASDARREAFARPDLGGDPVTVWMPVIDRPGVLAEVTTTAAQVGVNIEDLRIAHSIEGGRGRLELIVTGEQAGERLAGALAPLGYTVHRLPPGDLA